MSYIVNGHNIFIVLLVTFLTSLLFVPIAKKIALHVGAVDKPNKRRINKVEMPTQGGLAIFASFLLGFILYGGLNYQMIAILIGGFMLIVTGLIDGINPIRPLYKMTSQVLAAAVVVIYGGIYLTKISFLGLFLSFPLYVSYIVSILFIVAIINAMNLIDGLDGLCGGISSIYFASIASIALILNRVGGLDIILTIIMLGSTLGFLVHNFPPAKIYLGDTGSMFLGYMISVIALLGFKVATLTSLVIPIVTLSIPIFDTTLAILRRKLKGESIGKPDKEHFHHQLLKMKFSPRTTILIIYTIDILFAVMSILFAVGDQKLAMLLYILVMILFLFMILKTDILFKHGEKNGK